jgi:hypothetical protein
MASNVDTNVENYTLSELMAIVDVNDLDPPEITRKTNILIEKFKNGNPVLSVFFREVQSQLLQYSMNFVDEQDAEYDNYNDDNNVDVEPSEKIYVEGFGTMSGNPIGEKEVNEWYENQNLKQTNQTQVDKITDRKQKVGIFGDPHVPMKRQQLGVNDTFQVPVKQDSLNPNLKNTITRFVNLDSQFRQSASGVDSTSTDYTLDLSDTLKNALSIRLYSYQIPFTWYAIDSAYGNTCFWITDAVTNYSVPVYVSPGNYTPTSFTTTLNAAFTTAGFVFVPGPPVQYNENNGKITLSLFNGVFTNTTTTFTIDDMTKITFYDFTGVLQCNTNCISKSNYYLNNTLGWLMGYRMPYIDVDPSGNVAPAVLDLNGTKYLILVIDDYNQNHVNNSLVSITQLSNKLKLPNYYTPDIPYTCLYPGQQETNLNEIVNNQTASNGFLVADKYNGDYSPTQIVLPSAPRTLTRNQLYTINEINKNMNKNTNYLSRAPTSPDILAIVPVKISGVNTGSLLVEFSGSLQDNIRTYFGPVDIDRMAVKLLDDKGNILNLNGADWCTTFICECLYQY